MTSIAANPHHKTSAYSCDLLNRYAAALECGWSRTHRDTQRVGMRRFDRWLLISKIPLSELTWQRLLEFHRFLSAQGIASRQCSRSVQVAKHVLQWAIRKGELPQKIEDLYTFHHMRHHWKQELPAASEAFLEQLEVVHPGAARVHRYAHRVFHEFLRERDLTYRRLRKQHGVAFVKYVKDKGFHQRTRGSLCRNVRAHLRWLYENSKIRRHADDILPARLIPKPVKSLPRPLDPETDTRLQQLLKETDDQIYQAILLIRRTGLRIAELRKLEFDCIEQSQKGRSSLKVPAVKLGIERRVPLDSETVELIHKIQQKTHQNHKKKTPPTLLVIGPTGLPPRYERYSDALTELCARLNTRKWINLHALRHTFATSLLNAGLSITSLKEILGHKTITMTLAYAKVSQEKIHAEYAGAIQKMNSAKIPYLLVPRADGVEAVCSDLAAHIARAIDCSRNDYDRRKLKGLLNRLSKMKTELIRCQNGQEGF